MKWQLAGGAILALLYLLPCRGAAEETSRRRLTAVRVSSPPAIDGDISDACWKGIAGAAGFTDSVLGTPVDDQTEVWIGYDRDCIYVAFHCRDAQPASIVARETRRGSAFVGEDEMRVRIDPFHSQRTDTESILSINPLGTQNATIAGGRAAKQEWEGVWHSAARIVADGWTGEFAIPWRILARPSGGPQRRNLGLNFVRYQARTQIKSFWSNLGPQARQELTGTWDGVEPPPVQRQNPLSVLAYGLGGYENRQAIGRIGADARYQFDTQMTAVASVNPDFSNVEGAVTGIDFSYAEKLAAERRPFFLEGADFYWTHGSGYRAFQSVRIPQFDLGGKFFGRVARGLDVGALTTNSFGRRSDTVLTLRGSPSAFDSIGAQVVNRSEPGGNNTVALTSGEFRRGDWEGALAYSRSFDGTGRGDSGRAMLTWTGKTWWAAVGRTWVSRLFTARDGYVPFTDVQGRGATVGYSGDYRTGPLTDFSVFLDSYHQTHYDGAIFQRGMSTGVYASLRNQIGLTARFADGRFEQNHDRIYTLSANYPTLDKFRNGALSYRWGRQDGFDYGALSASLNWRFRDRLSVSATTEVVRLEATASQNILSASYDLSRRETVGGRLIATEGGLSWYLSFRHSGYTGAEYYVILGDPNTPRFSERLVVKFVQKL